MNEVARIDRAPLVAGHKPMAIVPTDFESAYRIANAVCLAGMAPKGLDTPEKALIAVLHGLEIGLTPMAALQRIAVVNGRPTIWGDAAIGLVRGSGLCEWIKERIEGNGDARIATCEAKRKGDPEPITGKFSVADAKKAGLWAKAGPWQQFPERMLQLRARAFCLRDGFADVLGGLYLREEIEETRQERPAPPVPPSRRLEPVAIEHQPAQIEIADELDDAAQAPAAASPAPPRPPGRAPSPVKAAPPVTKPFDPEATREAFVKAAAAAQDIDALNEAWATIIAPHEADAFPGDLSDWASIHRKREHELEG